MLTVKKVKLSPEVFEIEPNTVVVKKAIKLQLDATRQGTAKTKTRAEVAGTNKKPYRQKGTGNARQGSKRAPHYVGGGIVFGVTPRSYAFKTNRKERTLALKSALTLKNTENKIIVVESLSLDTLKTKNAVKMLNDLKITGKVLFVTSGDAENLYMATRNLKNTQVILACDINVYDIVNAEVLVIDEQGVKFIEEVLK